MSFLDHLEELRWHIIRSLIAIVIFAVAAFLMKEFVFGTIIFGPSRTDFWTYRWLCQMGDILNSEALCIDTLPFIIQSRKVTGQFSMHITSSFVIGLVLAFPYAFWEIWRFVSPGLYSNEKQISQGATFFCEPAVYNWNFIWVLYHSPTFYQFPSQLSSGSFG